MRFADNQFLDVSRSARLIQEPPERLANVLAAQEARRRSAALKRNKRRPLQTVRKPVRAAFGGERHRA